MSEVEPYIFRPTIDDLSVSPAAQQRQGRVGRTKPGMYVIDRVVQGEVVSETADTTINAKELESSKEL